MAARLDKPPSYVHKVETAERELNIIEFLDYCDALDVDTLEFVSEMKAAVVEVRRSKPWGSK